MTNSKAPDILDNPLGFLRMGQGLVGMGKAEAAMALAARALDERPDDPLLAALARQITAGQIASFHDIMLADEPRNRAYRAAIEALAPGRQVLDIGTGSGLLAMCAARAGASRVDACEADPRLACTAREIVAANGLAEQVSVIARPSTALDRETDLGGGADLVVSELFAEDLLLEGVIPTLNDAHARLVRPGAVFLPAAATMRIALAHLPDDRTTIGVVEGFDLSLFNRHAETTRTVRQGDPELVIASAPADLFRLDFSLSLPVTDEAAASLVLTGPATGIIQWFHLDLAPDVTFENRPGGADSHWRMIYHPLPGLRELPLGATAEIRAWREERSYQLWLT